MLLSLLLVGCQPDDVKESPEDTGYAYVDTAPVVDTAPDTDSGADTAVDTDTGGDTTDTGAPTWLSLEVWPSRIRVHPGATFSLRVVATDAAGARVDLPTGPDVPVFRSDAGDVAQVDDTGLVTAHNAGAAVLTVSHGGQEATVRVEVEESGTATIVVLDGKTGLPIEGASVAGSAPDPVATDAAGTAVVPVPDGGPQTFSVWVDDRYDALTVVDVVGRELTLSLLPKDTVENDALLAGAVDFAGVDDGEWSDVVVGFAAASIQGSLAATRLEDLFADERAITVFGVDVDAPANLFVEGAAPDYAARALAGPVAAWGLGGPIPIADATAGFSGSGDALKLLADNMGAMSWGHRADLVAVSDDTLAVDLAPIVRFDARTPVSLPPLSLGFHGDEVYFLLVAEERLDEGFVVTGLGTGGASAVADVPTVLPGNVADSLGTSALAYAQVGGIGSGGATSAAVASDVVGGALVVPPLQDIPSVDAWEPTTRGVAYTVDADAHFVRVRLKDERNRIHDILAPSSWSGTIPTCVTNFRLPQASIEVLALQTSGGSYEAWLAGGDLSVQTKPAVSAARTTQE